MSDSRAVDATEVQQGKESANQVLNTLVGKVYNSLQDYERRDLTENGQEYIDGIMKVVVNNADKYRPDLQKLIPMTYDANPTEERFIMDPIRKGPLLIDNEGEIVGLKGAVIEEASRENPGDNRLPGERFIARYDGYQILSGRERGQNFTAVERPLPPVPPKFQPTPSSR